MKFKLLAAVLTLVTAGPALADCTASFNLGAMGPPALRTLSNTFASVQHFSDCYNFTLNGPTDSFGFTFELDASLRRDIDLTSITLSGGNLGSALTDPTASSFSFSNLVAGTYEFVISGDVTGRNGGLFGGGLVGYSGVFATTADTVAVAPVPEPATYLQLAAGLLAVGWVMRRRQQI